MQLIGARLTRQVEQAENETAIVHFRMPTGMTRGVRRGRRHVEPLATGAARSRSLEQKSAL